MARKRQRPIKYADIGEIAEALAQLKMARARLRRGGAHHAAAYVGRALKSAEGAFNHAQRMWRSR